VSWTSVPVPDPVAPSEIPAQSTAAATKVVDPALTPNGSTIFSTIQAAFDTLNPGDVLTIAPGTYNEAPVLTRSGTVGSRIYIRCADYANRPTIAGNYTLPVGWGAGGQFVAGQAALFSVQARYVTIDGINVRDSARHGIIAGECANNGSFVASPNTFYEGVDIIRCSAIGTQNSSIRTINTDGCRIIGCTFLDSERSVYEPNFTGGSFVWGSAVFLIGKNPVLIENVIGQSMGEGLSLGYHGTFGGGDGYAHIEVTNAVVRGNKFFDCWSAPAYLTNVDGGVFERNIIWNRNDPRFMYAGASGYAQYGLDIASESGRGFANNGVTGFNGFVGARNLTIRNNIIGNALRPFRFQDEPSQQTNNVRVYNNTIYRTTPGSAASVASVISNNESELSDIFFKNNLVYDVTPAQMCRQWLTPSGTWSRGRNIWSTAPPATLNGTGDIITASPGVTNLAYQPSGTYPAVSTFDTSQLKLTAGSVAVNAGEVLSEVPTDFFGVTRPTGSGNIDIGACSRSKPLSFTQTVTGLPAGTNYFRVRAIDSAGAVTPNVGTSVNI
jgi:hypothetical protein